MQETWQFIIRKGNNNSWRIYYMPRSRLNLSPVSSVLKSCLILFACLMCGWDFKGLNEFLKFSQLVNGRGGVLSQVIWPKRQLGAHPHPPHCPHSLLNISHYLYPSVPWWSHSHLWIPWVCQCRDKCCPPPNPSLFLVTCVSPTPNLVFNCFKQRASTTTSF